MCEQLASVTARGVQLAVGMEYERWGLVWRVQALRRDTAGHIRAHITANGRTLVVYAYDVCCHIQGQTGTGVVTFQGQDVTGGNQG